MSTKKYGLVSALFALLLFSFALAEAQNDSAQGADAPVMQAADNSDKGRVELPDHLVLKPHAYAHLEAGQIENGSLRHFIGDVNNDPTNYKIDHVWTEDALLEFGFAAEYMKHLKLDFSIGTKLYFSYPQRTDEKYTKNMRQDVYIDQLISQYHFGNPDIASFMGQVGFFKYKYNPDARNLGEYLFRTGTYPIYFDSWFDFPEARLLGLQLGGEFLKSLKLDLFLVSATVYPTMNWSLAGVGSYDVANLHFIEIGAGFDFAHLFDVYTNHSFQRMFGGDPTEPHGNFNDTYVDPATGDTSYYTFKGTKLMGRISLDPKAFIPWKGFGKNDLRLYVEADIIGLKNYPDSGFVNGQLASHDLTAPSYDSVWQRMPVAIGFNFPTFKVLDVLNLEMEWFGAKYYNDESGLINQGSKPLPSDVQITDANPRPIKSKVKWSVYAKKSFFNDHFALTAQVARDHMRLQTAAYNYEMYNELLIEYQDWWWALKASWMF